jgi:hypothetical protein
MSHQLSSECVFNIVNTGATAAQTAVTSSAVDMAGFDAISFVATLAAVTDTSVLTLTVYENATNSNSGGTAISGAATTPFTASTSSNTALIVDVIRPSKRYTYCTLTRTTANAVVSNIVSIQYRSKSLPVSQGSAIIASALSTPEA